MEGIRKATGKPLRSTPSFLSSHPIQNPSKCKGRTDNRTIEPQPVKDVFHCSFHRYQHQYIIKARKEPTKNSRGDRAWRTNDIGFREAILERGKAERGVQRHRRSRDLEPSKRQHEAVLSGRRAVHYCEMLRRKVKEVDCNLGAATDKDGKKALDIRNKNTKGKTKMGEKERQCSKNYPSFMQILQKGI